MTGDKTSLGGRQPQPDVDGLVERTAAFERLLEEALFSFPLSERVRSAHNIAVFDCAVKQLLDQVVSREIAPPKELLNDVNRAMESIQPALTRLLSATNPIERDRSLQAVDSAAENESRAINSIALFLDPNGDPTAGRMRLALYVQQTTMARSCDQVDLHLKRLSRAIAENHRQEEERRGRFEEALSGLHQQLANEAASARQDLKDLSHELETVRSEAQNFLGTLVAIGTSSGYQEAANREGRTANLWRWIALFFGILGVGSLLVALAIDRNPTPASISARIAIFAAFGGVAAYAGRQSAEHRREERALRSLQLQLAAFGPWIADLPLKIKEKLKKRLSETFFRVTDYDKSDISSPAVSPLPMDQLREILSQAISSVRDKDAKETPRDARNKEDR